MSETLEVLSVNISEKKGTIKIPVEKIVIDEFGVKSDAHAGKWGRQISMLGEESFEKFSKEAGRKIHFGEFAENITTKGLLLYNTNPLDRFISGSLVLEVTQIGKKCHGSSCNIFKEVGNCVMPKEGIFCRVIHAGELRQGDKMIFSPKILKVSVITISDRASAGFYNDESGPAVVNSISCFFKERNQIVEIFTDVVPDDPQIIKEKVIEAVNRNTDIIITTGGTGIGPRDFTPDVISELIDKEIPGIMDFIRMKSGSENPNALISRSIAGVKNKSLIYSLPGSIKAVKEYMLEINKTLMHTIYMLNGLNLH